MSEKKQTNTGDVQEEKGSGFVDRRYTNGKGHRFVMNNVYFTVCIYAFVLVVMCAIAIKAIVSFDSTKAFVAGAIRAMGPFLIALLIAYILTPFVRRVDELLAKCFSKLHEKIRMMIALFVVYLLAVGLIIALLIFVMPQVVSNLAELIGKIPDAYDEVLAWVEGLQDKYPKLDMTSITDMLKNTQRDLTSSLTDISKIVIPRLYTASVSVVTWFSNFIIAMVVSVYMLYGKTALRRILKIVLYTFLPVNKIPDLREIFTDCSRIFSQYVVAKLIDSLIIGCMCAVLMTILRLPYVFLISILVGVTNMIPYFGPFIGAVPGVVIQLVVNPVKAIIFFVMILCLQQFDGLYLGPKLMGNSTGMKPIWIIFAITIGGKLFGVIGMFLGVPAFAILAYLGNRFVTRRLAKKNLNLDDIQ